MSVDTLNADLATLRGTIGMWRYKREGDWDSRAEEVHAALDRVEAELSRLREGMENGDWLLSQAGRRLEAAEARCARLTEENERLDGLRALYLQSADDWSERCARLQQALAAWQDAYPVHRPECNALHGCTCGLDAAREQTRRALAGPDTPADSHSWNQPLAKLEDGKWVDPFVPADSQEDTA